MLDRSDDERYLDGILARREDRGLEFKRAANSFERDRILAYCAALANSGGGLLGLGVSDDHEVHGTRAVGDSRSMELLLHEKLPISVTIRELSYEGKRVLVFQIAKRRRGEPVGHNGRYQHRVGESLVDMTPQELRSIFDESRVPSDTLPAKQDLSASEVAQLLDVDQYFKLLERPRPMQLHDALASLVVSKLLTLEEHTGLYTVTTAGALFLAKDLGAFDLGMRRIRLIRYAATDRINTVFEKFETRGYGLCFEDMLDLIQAHAPVMEIIDAGRRQTQAAYPSVAIREFLANALIHQDLDEHGVHVTVEIFEDRLEVRNPGLPLIDVKRFVDETIARNPDLADCMRRAGICEIRGSGVDRALNAIEDLTRPAPRFIAGSHSTSIVLRKEHAFDDMNMDERVWAAFLHACVKHAAGACLTNASLRSRFGLPTSKIAVVSQTIAAAVELNILKPDPRAGSSRRHARYLPFFA